MDLHSYLDDYTQILDIPKEGYYSEQEFLWVIEKQEKWNLDTKRCFLHFGNAGCDGIEFGLRSNKIGVWAYYLIEDEYLKIAQTITEFCKEWIAGRIQL